VIPQALPRAVLAFATCLDERAVVLFLARPGQRTVPGPVFAGLKDTIELTILAPAMMLTGRARVLMVCVLSWRAAKAAVAR